MKSEITKLSLSPQPSTILREKHIHISGCVYGLQKHFNHTQVQVSGSLNSDPVNSKYTVQQSTDELLGDELEECFI